MSSTTLLMLGEKTNMGGIKQNGLKSLISLGSPSRESNQKYLVLPMEGSCSCKDIDNSDNSDNGDNDKDNSDNENNSNMKITK